MAAGPDSLLRYVRQLVLPSELEEATDAALLGRFISARDERAFAALVYRHGPLVLQVCRRILGNVEDAEDAFQATFLVLVRKAATVRPREALPAWLHGVARRAALQSRLVRVRQFRLVQPLAVPPVDLRSDPPAELSARELLALIDEEVQRLPEVYRLPVILCCLEGRSQEEAARQLGWTPGSVKGRLERGRARLHRQLARHGLTLSAALAAVELSRSAAWAAVVARLATPSLLGALVFESRRTAALAGLPAGAAALAGQVVQGMALAKFKIAGALMLAGCLLITAFLILGAGETSSTTATQLGTSPLLAKDREGQAAPAALFKNQPGAPANEDHAPVEVSGRVLDPTGRPLAGAKLYVGYSVRVRPYGSDLHPGQPAYPLRDISKTDGRFHFAFARSELDAKWLDDSQPAVVAVADGFGPDWAEVGESGTTGELTLKLVEDVPLNGRILDHNRKPVAGAKILVHRIFNNSADRVTQWLQGDSHARFDKSWGGALPGQPPHVTTDVYGQFRMTGVGRERIVSLALEGPAIQHTFLRAVTRPSAAIPASIRIQGATFDYVAVPSRPIRGVVRDKATGKPVAGVTISSDDRTCTTVAGQDGGYQLLGFARSQPSFVIAQPQDGQPYFAASASVPDGPGVDALTVNFDLVSGIPLSGRVTDQATGKPPKTAVVAYYPLFPNSHSKITNLVIRDRAAGGLSRPAWLAASSARVRADGSYSLVTLPGPGVVLVAASPRNSYAVAMVDAKELADLFHDRKYHGGEDCLQTGNGVGGPGLVGVNKYNALALINPQEKVQFLALDLTLQPAGRLRGTVVGPEGEPLEGVKVDGLTALPLTLTDEILESASFTIVGLNPRRSRDLFFYHRGKGKFLTIGPNETEPLIVRLDPCGSITGRLVDKGGNPVPGATVWFMVQGLTVWFSSGMMGIDDKIQTDREGRFRASLVPGKKYALRLESSPGLMKVVGDVQVESGRSKDLGDLVLGH